MRAGWLQRTGARDLPRRSATSVRLDAADNWLDSVGLTAAAATRIVGARMTIDAIQLEEFRALRAAIRERTIARVLLLTLAWVGWAALATAIMLVLPAVPLLALPLVVLLAAFEVNLGTVRGAERIAAYVRLVFEERRAVPGWETASADLARRYPAMAGDPLFFWVFVAVICANYLCVVIAAGETADPSTRVREDSLDLALVTALHGAVLLRFVLGRRALMRGRRGELERVRTVLAGDDPGAARQPDAPPRHCVPLRNGIRALGPVSYCRARGKRFGYTAAGRMSEVDEAIGQERRLSALKATDCLLLCR